MAAWQYRDYQQINVGNESMPEVPLAPLRQDSASSAVSARRLSADSSNRGALERSAKRLARKVRQFQPAQACPWTLLAGSGFLQNDTWGKKQVWRLEGERHQGGIAYKSAQHMPYDITTSHEQTTTMSGMKYSQNKYAEKVDNQICKQWFAACHRQSIFCLLVTQRRKQRKRIKIINITYISEKFSHLYIKRNKVKEWLSSILGTYP